jgi:hypothetical protein
MGDLAWLDRTRHSGHGLFNKQIRIYETINTGWWYDFGYYIAIISGFGGLSLFRHKRRIIKSGDE